MWVTTKDSCIYDGEIYDESFFKGRRKFLIHLLAETQLNTLTFHMNLTLFIKTANVIDFLLERDFTSDQVKSTYLTP